MVDSEEYVYEVISDEKNARICAKLLADEFVAHELFTNMSSISSEQFLEEFAWPSMKNTLDEGLSFLARHRSSGEIVGAIIADDLYMAQQKYPNDPSCPPAKLPIFDLIGEMDDMFISHDFGQDLKPGLVLLIWFGATRTQHTKKGLGTQLRKAMFDHAHNTKGFQYALVQATHPATRRIYLTKMGGKIVTEVDAKNWIWKKKGSDIYPYKEYSGAPIPNILIKLVEDEKI